MLAVTELRDDARALAEEQRAHSARVKALAEELGTIAIAPSLDDLEADVVFGSRVAAHAVKRGVALTNLCALKSPRIFSIEIRSHEQRVAFPIEEAIASRIVAMHARNTKEFFAHDEDQDDATDESRNADAATVQRPDGDGDARIAG